VARRERSLKVEVPKPEQDRAELGRVGVIAAAGFVIGVVWPWLAGVRLVPSPPTDDAVENASVPSASSAAGNDVPAPSASAVPAAPSPEERTHDETVKLGELQVFGCRDHDRKLKDCDKVNFDGLARGHLAALAACDAAKGASETLSIGFELDFERKIVSDVFSGKSTTFPKSKAEELVLCAKKEFASVRLDGLTHEHQRYTVFYFVEFVPPGSAVAADAPGTSASPEPTTEASGLATVSWDVAVVRDEPEKGKVQTRLRYGTRVLVAGRRGNWYLVKYDAKGAKGWVHRNALGL
jgi:hypothetical protein